MGKLDKLTPEQREWALDALANAIEYLLGPDYEGGGYSPGEVDADLEKHKEEDRKAPRYIYALIDPTDGSPRYVGQTKNKKSRLYEHNSIRTIRMGTPVTYFTPKEERLKELKELGLRWELKVLEKTTRAKALERERYWRRRLEAEGCDLFEEGT